MNLVARVDFRDAKLGLLRKGQPFEAPDNHGLRLIRLRCAVRPEDGAPYQTKVVRPQPDPEPAGGEDSTSFASPPAQASPQTTASASDDGDSTPKRRRRKKQAAQEEE
jgi:hypothetical protein